MMRDVCALTAKSCLAIYTICTKNVAVPPGTFKTFDLCDVSLFVRMMFCASNLRHVSPNK